MKDSLARICAPSPPYTRTYTCTHMIFPFIQGSSSVYALLSLSPTLFCAY